MLGLRKLFRGLIGFIRDHRADLLDTLAPYAEPVAKTLFALAIDPSNPASIDAAKAKILELAQKLGVAFAKEVFLSDDGTIRAEVVENMPVRDLKGWLGKLLLLEAAIKAGLHIPENSMVGLFDSALQFAYEHLHD